MRPFLAGPGFAQTPGWQHAVVVNHSVIVNQQDVQSGFHIPVLEGIVQQNDIYVTGFAVVHQPCYSTSSVRVNRNIYIGEFLLYHPWFVADFFYRCVLPCQYVATGASHVASAQDRYPVIFFQ